MVGPMSLSEKPTPVPRDPGDNGYESVPKPMKPKGRKAAISGITAAVGSLVTALIMSITARIDANTAEERSKRSQVEATSTSEGARSQAALTSIELSASYTVIVDRLEGIEDAIEKIVDHSDYLERRSERIESLLFQVAGNTSAVRAYAPPERPESHETATSRLKDELPASPNKALQQQLIEDPSGVFN
jgi:hypothetical protein